MACRDEMNQCILVYLPVGKTIAVKTGKMTCDKVACWWYNPRNGQAEKIGLLNRVDTMKFTPPTVGINNEWLLIIDNPE